MKSLNFTEEDLRQVFVSAAESQMSDFERNPLSRSAAAYLHVAETNLMSAERQGVDTSKQRARLERLQQYQ